MADAPVSTIPLSEITTATPRDQQMREPADELMIVVDEEEQQDNDGPNDILDRGNDAELDDDGSRRGNEGEELILGQRQPAPQGRGRGRAGRSCPNLSTWRNKHLLVLLATAVTSMVLAAVFLGLYINERRTPKRGSGEVIPTPVILKISSTLYADPANNNPPLERMFISGYNNTYPEEEETPPGIVRWRSQDDFWYLEVLPLTSTGKNCPTRGTSLFGRVEPVLELNPLEISSCNLYDFRLTIYNDLDDQGATVHFHGLTPPSNQDGVPFVANANINPKNLQNYRFNQFTYPGLHWMHAHTGFQQAFGVSAPIVLQHNDLYSESNGFSIDDDLVIMFEDGTRDSKCSFPFVNAWYKTECKEKNSTNADDVALLINRREIPLVHTPNEGAKSIRVRFVNGGSLANWNITTAFSMENNGTRSSSMEILATDGQDVVKGVKSTSFVLGLANRIDVLVTLDPKKDILISGVQLVPYANTTEPALRHIVIRGRDTPQDEKIEIQHLPTYWNDGTGLLQENFDLLAKLTAAHPLIPRSVDRSFTIWNRGGDIEGGYILSTYKGIINPNSTDLQPLHPYDNYTQLNNLKFQLPPYKVFRNSETQEFVSTTRDCSNCAGLGGNIRKRPQNGADVYPVSFDPVKFDSQNPDDTCCWEWCDVPEEDCKKFKLEEVKYFEPNKNYIPVCYGDRVRILFVNTLAPEGHPIHLHGHDFTLRKLYDIGEGNVLTEKTKYRYDISGPKLDTIYIPYNQAVEFDFDAYNPGEHLIHCHIDIHLEGGMMTTVRYMHGEECDDLPNFLGGENYNGYPSQFCKSTGCVNE